MKSGPQDIALSLYKITGAIFVSLKEQAQPAIDRARSEARVKQLTFTQLRVLLAIEYGKNQVGKLARSAQVAQPAMSKIVAHLIDRGYARRDPHPTDRRQIRLSLTRKGSAMTERVLRNAAEKYVKAIKVLSVTDRRKMVDGIAVILKVLETTRKQDA